MSKNIFVTVGTTKFDRLINTVTDAAVLKELNRQGYDHLTLQIGNSDLKPNCTSREGFAIIESFGLKPSIQEYMASADLVISHAGAGSCLEALALRKPLIVVTNELLMDNHQLELAEQLSKDNHLFYCTCDTFLNVLMTMNLKELIPFVSNRSKRIAECIDRIMGFPIYS